MIELKKVLKTNGRYLQILAENGIHTVADLLQYFPRAYEDRSSILTLKNLYIDGQTTIATKGQIIEKKFSPR
jgi:RecG-like helicase